MRNLAAYALAAVALCALVPVAAEAQTCQYSTTQGGQPSSPAANATVSSGVITFSWTAAQFSGATYDLLVGPAGGSITQFNVRCSSVTGTSCSPNLTTGAYEWIVRSKQATNCPAGVNSPRRALNVSLCPTIGINPSSLAATTVNQSYSQTFTATNGSGQYTWALASGSLPAGLAFSNAGVLSGTPTATGTFTFTVEATDQNRCTGTRQYSLTVNPNCPTITISPTSFNAGTVGQSFNGNFTSSGGVSPYSYSIVSGALPPGLSLQGAIVSGTPTTAGNYSFTVESSDANRCTARRTYSMTINAACPTITVSPASLPNGFTGDSYRATISATGGTAPYTFSVSAGTLPPGVALESGVLNGTPTAAGDYSFSIRATDANNCADSRAYRVTIVNCPSIAVTPISISNGVVGESYRETLNATGGTGPYSFSTAGGSLPPGLSLSGNLITGTPTATGNYAFTIRATDANGCGGTRQYNVAITVACPTITLTPSTLPNGQVGSSYQSTLGATGGTAPYTFTLVAGNLPAGLTLANGAIFGTPTAATSNTFGIRATDANNCTATRSYTLTVTACNLVLGPASLSNGAAGVAYQASLTAVNGTAPYTYALDGGTLPPGITLAAAGTLSGTPTTAGTYTFVVRLTDGTNCTTTRQFSLTIASPQCPQLSLTPSSLPSANTGTQYTAAFSVSGGSAPYSYSVAGGSLPPGLALSGGTLGGTPTTAGNFTFVIQGSDANRCTVSQSYTLTVTTTCRSLPPTLLTPANGASTTVPVTFSWNEVLDATSYRLYIVSGTSTTPTLAGSTTSNQLTLASIPQGTITWFVQALFSNNCPLTESSRRTLTVTGASNCPTGTATLIAPASGATSVQSPVAFDWSDVPNAVAYRLFLGINGADPSPVAFRQQSDATLTMPSGATSAEWFVESMFNGSCPSTTSSHFRFTLATQPACATNPAPPTLTSPANGAANVQSPVTLQWTAVSNATLYRVFASLDGGALAQIGSTANTALTVNIPQGTVTWFVTASFASDDCPSVVSTRSTFTVSTATDCRAAVAPSLVAPANNATNAQSPVEFRWNAVPNASNYQLWVSLNGSAFAPVGSTTETELERIAPPGSYQWYVVAQFQGCPEQRSQTFSFTVASTTNCPDGTIALNAPANGATVQSPVAFSWSAVSGVGFYRLWVALDGGTPQVVARVTTNSATVPVPSGEGEWFVEGVTENCRSIVSPHARFTVPRGANCNGNAAPTLVAPASGAEVTNPVEFRWNAVPNAVGYQLWISANGQPFADVGSTRETTLRRELPGGGTFLWFVVAAFEACPPTASERRTFTMASTAAACSTDAPVILSPANGATNVGSPVTLLWTAVSGAVDYRVFASLDGGALQLIGVTSETSLTRPAPPGTILWLVEAVFRNCPSTRSSRSTFTVARAANCNAAAPQLLSPASGADNVASPVSFNWTPVNGAVGYVVWARAGDGAPTRVGETIATHLERPMPEGAIEWWVAAYLAGCPPVESEHSRFTIATTSCTNVKPVLLTPVDGAQGVVSPVRLSWTPVRGARGYRVWAAVDGGEESLIGSTDLPALTVTVPSGLVRWFVQAVLDGCPPSESAPHVFTVLRTPPPCGTPQKPRANVVGQVLSNTTYTLRWTPLPNVTLYEVQESTTADFSNATTQTVNDVFTSFTHAVTGTPRRYLYRVRGVSACNEERGPYSDVVGVYVVPIREQGRQRNTSAENGTTSNIVQTLTLPPQNPPTPFTISIDKPWLTATPSQGTVGEQPVTIVITADPGAILLGTNTATVTVTYGTAAGTASDKVVTTTATPVSVSLVTPVSPTGGSTPPPDALIIPAVAHAAGANDSQFESDVRVTNVSTATQRYNVRFTPSQVDGTQNGSSTEIQIAAGATMALDDILANFFGAGSSGESATGTLELRPITTSTSGGFSTTSASTVAARTTVASSRTYNSTATGTFGQYIPAIPFSQFIGRTNGRLSLQQIAQSAAYRTNFGLVEAAGEPASLLIHVFNAGGDEVAQIVESLQPGEHRQINTFLSAHNISLEDGRIEVEVTSDTGRVTAYASTVDNATNDPLCVSPVVPTSISASRYVLPGVADINNGLASWRTDVRLFNAGSSPVTATLSYYAQGQAATPMTTQVTLNPGEVRAIDNSLQALFNLTNSGGSLVVTTPGASSLVATARTYNQTSNGTYGQFIPGVTVAESVKAGGPALQVLQLEQSTRFRSNIGVAETSGQPATAEVSVILPDTRTVPKTTIPLAANEFKQISLGDFGIGTVYNARVTVKVTGGNGSVTAYGSVIDQVTQDPSYVPAQY